MAKATIKRDIDEYGFEKLEIHTSEGGTKIISYYGAGAVDIGMVLGSNPGGLGGSDYIRRADDVKRHMSNVKRTVWLNDEEKAACLEFLQEIELRAFAFLTVKERFDVKFSYQASKQGHNTFTFTEKEDPLTMHTKISITIEQPSGWSESNAWMALYRVLNPLPKSAPKGGLPCSS